MLNAADWTAIGTARVVVTVSNALSRPASPQKNYISLILFILTEGPVVAPGTDDDDVGKPPGIRI
jgi:hypothetical protein